MLKALLDKRLLELPTLAYKFAPRMTNALIRRLHFLFPNSIAHNRSVWSRYNWDAKGEEWSNSPAWKQSFLDHVLSPHVPAQSRVLEIGPGAGRWTEHLLPRAAHLTLVDLVPECIAQCREKFGEGPRLTYHANDGRDLSFVPDGSIDRIWSWAVFVHLDEAAVEGYLRQFPRILAPGGRGLIQHARNGVSIGWRSPMTAKKMRTLCERHGLAVVDQFNTWDEGRHHIWPDLPLEKDPDIVTIFEKPRNEAGRDELPQGGLHR